MKRSKLRSLFAVAVGMLLTACASVENDADEHCCNVLLSPLFSEHAVLQRNMPLPVWGYATPGSKIAVELNVAKAETLANGEGYFIVRLPAQEAGGPFELKITDLDAGTVKVIPDVWLGEVWLAGGQSNMAYPVSSMRDVNLKSPEQTLRPQVRYFRVPLLTEPGELRMVPDGEWQIATPETIGDCSAVGYYFARKLNDELGIPIGIIHSNWGGTTAQGWISRKGLMTLPETRSALQNEKALNAPDWWRWYESKFVRDWLLVDHSELSTRFRDKRMAEQRAILADNVGVRENWFGDKIDAMAWTEVKIPGYWSDNGDAMNINGSVWFRTEFEVPESMAGQDLKLHIGAVDKTDETYVNGVKVGATGELFNEKVWNLCRVYDVPAAVLRPGVNVLAVRNISHIYGGGLTGPADEMCLTDGREKISLADCRWVARIEHNFGKVGGIAFPATMYISGILYQNMIAPLLPMAMRGVVWYQGEANAGNPWNYCKLMETLIKDWRYNFENPDLAFLQVQLAGFGTVKDFDDKSNWALIRDAQREAAAATGNLLATAHEIGEENDIHPQHKANVGERLAACALRQSYGKGIAGMGPELAAANWSTDGRWVALRFNNVGNGLRLRCGDTVRTLYAAGRDGKFVEAAGTLSGDELTVLAPREIEELCEVRYAWSDNPANANVENSDGLPMVAFKVKK